MEHLFGNMINITCWLFLFLIGIPAVPLLIIFQSLESCHVFFFSFVMEVLQRETARKGTSQLSELKDEKTVGTKKDKANCCLKSGAWCRQALKMKVACKGSEVESGELSHLGAWKQMLHFLTQAHNHSQSFIPACIETASYYTAWPIVCTCFLRLPLPFLCPSCYWLSFIFLEAVCPRELKELRICFLKWLEENDR